MSFVIKKIDSAVPTNIITGFLGAGKTTLIKHLLSQKPEHERWAILVNEFGEVGIDGALLDTAQHQQIFIREVPGGCMCCTSNLPMQVALNQLLAEAKPDRLIIEPTGIGHPSEIVEALNAPHYRDVLKLNGIVTLVDARKIDDPRYTSHNTFREQLAIADVIVATKSDTYSPDQFDALQTFLAQEGITQHHLTQAIRGDLDIALLEINAKAAQPTFSLGQTRPSQPEPVSQTTMPQLDANGMCELTNQGEGFRSMGWVFDNNKVFCSERITRALANAHENPQLAVERIKAVFRTEQGVKGFNIVEDECASYDMKAAKQSLLEVITSDAVSEAVIRQVLLTPIINAELDSER